MRCGDKSITGSFGFSSDWVVSFKESVTHSPNICGFFTTRPDRVVTGLVVVSGLDSADPEEGGFEKGTCLGLILYFSYFCDNRSRLPSLYSAKGSPCWSAKIVFLDFS